MKMQNVILSKKYGRTIKLSEVKPLGNLDSILLKLEKAVLKQEKTGYQKGKTADLIKLIVAFGFVDAKDWFDGCVIDGEVFEGSNTPEEIREAESIVLLGHYYVSRLNKIAQKSINNIDTGSFAENLMSNKKLMKYFPNTQLID